MFDFWKPLVTGYVLSIIISLFVRSHAYKKRKEEFFTWEYLGILLLGPLFLFFVVANLILHAQPIEVFLGSHYLGEELALAMCLVLALVSSPWIQVYRKEEPPKVPKKKNNQQEV